MCVCYGAICVFQSFFGDLMMTEVQYGGSRGRRWKVDWNRTPQPIQIKLQCLRGVKDKLPSMCALSLFHLPILKCLLTVTGAIIPKKLDPKQVNCFLFSLFNLPSVYYTIVST